MVTTLGVLRADFSPCGAFQAWISALDPPHAIGPAKCIVTLTGLRSGIPTRVVPIGTPARTRLKAEADKHGISRT